MDEPNNRRESRARAFRCESESVHVVVLPNCRKIDSQKLKLNRA